MPPKKKSAKKTAKKGPSVEKRTAVGISRRKDCPDCGSMNIIFDPETEQLICQDCGLIFEELPPDMSKKYEQVDEL